MLSLVRIAGAALLALAPVLLSAGSANAISGPADDQDLFPFVVQVVADGTSFCSGVLIYPRIVVTAAHCVVHDGKAKRDTVILSSVAEGAEVFVVTSSGTETFTATSILVSDAYVSERQPDWDGAVAEVFGARVAAADVAIVVLDRDAEIEPVRSLGALFDWESFYRSMDGENDFSREFEAAYSEAITSHFPGRFWRVTLVGYGQDDIRKYREARVFGIDRCTVVDPEVVGTLMPWCASSKAEALVEQGDSGGALLALDADGNWVLLGVLSLGVMRDPSAPMSAGEYNSMFAATYLVLRAADGLGYLSGGTGPDQPTQPASKPVKAPAL